MKKIIDYILLCFILQIFFYPSSAYAERLSSGKVYVIRSAMNNDYVIDVQNQGSSNGTNIQLHRYSDTRAQKFIIQSVKDGYFKIIDKNSGKAIDVRGGIAGNEVNVHLWQQNGTDAQMF